MKIYTSILALNVKYLLRNAFQSVVDYDKAMEIVDELNDHIHISVTLEEISIAIYCDKFTADFLANNLASVGYNAKEYENDIKRIELIKKI